MKFGENLDKVRAQSDPGWDPYWPNYNILKQLIKGLPSKNINSAMASEDAFRTQPSQTPGETLKSKSKPSVARAREAHLLKKDRGEVIFFKLLHADLKKATYFFEQTQQQYLHRAEQLQAEMESVDADALKESQSQPHPGELAMKIFQLHQDLLRLETFAIMTYCGCSKILKKHDKVTGFQTREAFMANVVHPASITETPQVSAMIERCQEWLAHPQLSRHWSCNNAPPTKPSADDQELFLDMVQRLKQSSSNSGEKIDATDCSSASSSSLVSMLSTVCQSIAHPNANWKRAIHMAEAPQPRRQYQRQMSCDSSVSEQHYDGDDESSQSSSSKKRAQEEVRAVEEPASKKQKR